MTGDRERDGVGRARSRDGAPVGLLEGAKVNSAVKKGDLIRYSDIELDATAPLVALRRAQDAMLG